MILRKKKFIRGLMFTPFLFCLSFRQVSSGAISIPEHEMSGNICFSSEEGELGLTAFIGCFEYSHDLSVNLGLLI